MKRPGGLPLPVLESGSEEAGTPAYVRLYRRIRRAILTGALPEGTRLPSSRTMMRDLRLSRGTVEAALGQLSAEGLLARRVGAGTFVAGAPGGAPRQPARFRKGEKPPRAWTPRRRRGLDSLSGPGRALATLPVLRADSIELLLSPVRTELELFPADAWRRIAARHARELSSVLLPGDPCGYGPLRRAVATYLAAGRGIRCDWRQVIIVASTQQALSLTARMLLDPGDEVWMEEPGYVAARAAFESVGASVVPVAVDEEGIGVAAGRAGAPDARLAYVTPSHQFPLGGTMSLARREELLGWAASRDAWIFEDDRDGELRYEGRPLAALQAIDDGGRVVHAGSFNRTLFTGLRLAYLVVPEDLVDPFSRGRVHVEGFPPTLPQAVLADFIEDGHLALLLRRARDLFAERRDVFRESVARELAGRARIGPAEAGLHATLHLSGAGLDEAVAERARRRGVYTPGLSRYYAAEPRRNGLLAYYSSTAAERIPTAVEVLRDVLDDPPAP
jgi:GntR family transcriptional regulator/MocR family aminotransferase